MHIVFICSEFSPYVEKSSLANDTVHLAKALKQSGHQVSVLLPSITDVDLKAHSLARRLSPVKVSVGDVEISGTRFDGRTADGIAVNLLDIAMDATAAAGIEAAAIQCAMTASLAASFAEVPDVCISFGRRLSGFSAAARQLPALAETVLIAHLGDVEGDALFPIPGADRVIVERAPSLGRDPIDTNCFVKISPAAPAIWVGDKPSEKTAFQMKAGLKVRSDIPLAVFFNFSKDALAAYLSADVQGIIFEDRRDCDGLKERYPDRLTVVSLSESAVALRAADACVCGDDALLVPKCLISGTVPVVTAAVKEDVVDLETSLESGTGIVVSTLDAPHLSDGLSRLTAAFQNRAAFQSLVRRLPGYAVTWPRVAATIENLVAEVKTENN